MMLTRKSLFHVLLASFVLIGLNGCTQKKRDFKRNDSEKKSLTNATNEVLSYTADSPNLDSALDVKLKDILQLSKDKSSNVTVEAYGYEFTSLPEYIENNASYLDLFAEGATVRDAFAEFEISSPDELGVEDMEFAAAALDQYVNQGYNGDSESNEMGLAATEACAVPIAVAAVSLEAQAAKCESNAAAANCAKTSAGAAALGVSAAKSINDKCMQLPKEFLEPKECEARPRGGICSGHRSIMRKVDGQNMCCH